MAYPIHTSFTRHMMTERDKEVCQKLLTKFSELAILILNTVPEGIEQTNALTRLEEVMFWSNAGIARH